MTRVFGVDYAFLSCGDVFTQGLVHAAEALGVTYAHADQAAPNLHRAVTAFNPDLLFVVHGRKFQRRWPRPVAPHSAVWLVDEPYEVDDTSGWSTRFDSVFLNDPGTLQRHARAHYLPVCYDPVIYYDDPAVPRPSAVGFIGGANPVRNAYLTTLATRNLLSYVVGGPFSPQVQRLSRGHNIPASQTADWYRKTQIVINIFRSQHHYNREQIPATSANPRVYEATACGALVVSEWRPELDTICPEMPTFRSPEECVDMIADLLAQPDKLEATRRACMARLKPHTYAARLKTVLQAANLAVAAA